MKISKKGLKLLSVLILTTSSVLLNACQTQSSNVITFTPKPTTSHFNTANQSAAVNVSTRDLRTQPEISSYVSDGNLIKLVSSPSVTQLFQQVVQQDLNSKGFRIAQPSASTTNVSINVKDFYAKVEQGNLRYKINAKIQLEIQVQGSKGQFVKNLGATRTQEGAFSAKNPEIQTVLRETLNEVVSAIYQDQEVAQAIQQYSH